MTPYRYYSLSDFSFLAVLKMALLLDGYNIIQQILLRIMNIDFKLETLLEVLWFSFLCRISLHITWWGVKTIYGPSEKQKISGQIISLFYIVWNIKHVNVYTLNVEEKSILQSKERKESIEEKQYCEHKKRKFKTTLS